MTEREFYIHNPDYYRWLSKAEQEGLVYQIAEEYYKYTDVDVPYHYTVNGNRHIVPVFFEYEWMEPKDLSSVIYNYNSTPFVNHSDSALKEIGRRSAITQNERGGDVSEYIWNNPTIGVEEVLSGSKGIATQLTDYYTVRSTSSEYNNELYRAAYNQGLSPTASKEQIRESLHSMDFPIRNQSYGRDIIIESERPFLLGQSTMTIFNTEDGLYYPIEYRNNRVTESPGWKNIIPTGVIQPEIEPDNSLEDGYQQISLNEILYTKTAAELFNKQYSAAQLEEDEANDKLSYINLGYGIDAVNSHIQLYNLLFVTDPELSETLISQMTQTWSSEYISMVDLSNKYQLQELLEEKTMIPYNIPAVIEALKYLENTDVSIPLNIS